MRSVLSLSVLLAVFSISLAAQNQRPLPTTAQSVRRHFAAVNQHLVEMAKDFPEDKYGFRLKPEMRTFGEVLVHIASGNVFAAKIASGEKVKWDELDAKNYPNKAAIVALMEKSSADAQAVVDKLPDESFAKLVEPWMEVMEHSAEHYGLLVAYYRANGIVPPQSRSRNNN
jgi:uncharacterized damage-inducible protein DinB